MDRKFLSYYNTELRHLRESGEEFAEDNPKIAARLGLSHFSCADPYVERLLEGFAFLAARVHLKLDEEFPRFTHSILNTVYPQYLMPTPSMTMVSFNPDMNESDLAEGFTIPKDTTLKSIISKGERTSCRFQTAHDVTLYPLEISDVVYQTGYRDTMEFGDGLTAAASLKITLESPSSIPFSDIDMDSLPVYIRDTGDDVPMRIYEQIFSSCIAMVLQSEGEDKNMRIVRRDIRSILAQDGFSPEQSLFPHDPRTFHGYRLIREYFAFPQRFMFFKLLNLKQSIRKHNENKLEIILFFDKADPGLDKKIGKNNFKLFTTPAINLFKKRTDRIHISKKSVEFPVISDRTKTLDYEIMSILDVTGFGAEYISGKPFRPFYSKSDFNGKEISGDAYYAEYRRMRSLTEKEKRYGAKSSYGGSDVYVSLVDEHAKPLEISLRELSVTALVSNRDLPVFMPVGKTETDFTLDINIPAHSVKCIEGPTPPKESFSEKTSEWNIINHLSLNYLTMLRKDSSGGKEILKDILKLYCDPDAYYLRRQIEGVMDVTAKPIIRRLAINGPVSFIRGLEVNVTLDEDAFRGTGVFLLGSLLDRYFGADAKLNSFTETVIHSQNRGVLKRWPRRSGIRELD